MLSNENKGLNLETIKHKQIKKSSQFVICRMLKNVRTAIDETGIQSIMREAGTIYHIYPALAQNLIKAGLAEEFSPIKPQETPEIKPKETKSILEKAKELIKPGKKNVDIAKELGITVNELKEIKKELKK